MSLLPGLAAYAILAGCAASQDAADGNVGVGGAQDFGPVRDVIERGGVPSPDLFDPGGFFAEHYVEQPSADCGQVLCLSPMLARGKSWLTQAPQSTLQLALTSTVDPSTLPRRPLSLVLVVDRSGSMALDDRLRKVQRGLHLLVGQLRPQDRVALVSFDDRVAVEVELTSSAPQLHAAVDALSPRGNTDLHEGLRTGLELAAAAASPAYDSRVMLLSDGLATSGVTSAATIEALADRFARRGVGLTTIGVGASFDLQLLRTLAEVGAGNFYFVEDAAAVDEVFTEELSISMSPLALDLQIVVTPTAPVSLGEITGRRGFSLGAQGVATISLPAAFAVSRDGAPPTAGRRGGGAAWFIDLTHLELREGSPVSVELSYRLPGAELRLTQRVELAALAAPSGDAELPAVDRAAMLKQVAMYNAYLGLHEGLLLAGRGSACAMPALRQVSAHLDAWNQVFGDADLAADQLLVDQLLGNLAAAGYLEAPVTYQACVDREAPDPREGDVDDRYQDDLCACATTSPRGLAPILLVALAVLRRRRRCGTVAG